MAIAFFQRNIKIEYILIIAYFHDYADYDNMKKHSTSNHWCLVDFFIQGTSTVEYISAENALFWCYLGTLWIILGENVT